MNWSPASKMEIFLAIFLISLQHGVTTERSSENIFIYPELIEEAILTLPEHLHGNIEYIFWKNENKQIAAGFANESLHISDPRYQGILSSSEDGSLKIGPTHWKDNDEYSADVILTDDTLVSINYHIIALDFKYIEDKTGPEPLYATAGEDLILPLKHDLINDLAIDEVDWLTDDWIYFAVTEVGGDIRILNDNYNGCLSSSPDGSLIFKKVTQNKQGMYRASIFSHDGTILVQTYRVTVFDPSVKTTWNTRAWDERIPVITLFCICVLLVLSITIYRTVRRVKKIQSSLDHMEIQKTLMGIGTSHV